MREEMTGRGVCGVGSAEGTRDGSGHRGEGSAELWLSGAAAVPAAPHPCACFPSMSALHVTLHFGINGVDLATSELVVFNPRQCPLCTFSCISELVVWTLQLRTCCADDANRNDLC